jgi:hypothetical protein
LIERTIFVPISEKQLAANRANAAQSTGPRTPEGKSRSCQNARTHGFTASTFAVVRLEEFDEIARLKHDLLSVYQPVNSQELFALEQMALAQQTMFRAARLESGIFTTCLDMALNHDGTPFTPMSPELLTDCDKEIARAQNRNYALADGFHRLARKDNTFPLLLRYKVQTERLYRRAVEEFERLKKLRPELPNEPILEVHPEENEPAYAPTDEPISNPQPNPEPPTIPLPQKTATIPWYYTPPNSSQLAKNFFQMWAGVYCGVRTLACSVGTHADVVAQAFLPVFRSIDIWWSADDGGKLILRLWLRLWCLVGQAIRLSPPAVASAMSPPPEQPASPAQPVLRMKAGHSSLGAPRKMYNLIIATPRRMRA